MNKCDILKGAREFMARKDLCKRNYYANAEGHMVSSHEPEKATACCIMGAIYYASKIRPHLSETPAIKEVVEAISKVIPVDEKAFVAQPWERNPVVYNDLLSTTKADVLKVFDAAIAASDCAEVTPDA